MSANGPQILTPDQIVLPLGVPAIVAAGSAGSITFTATGVSVANLANLTPPIVIPDSSSGDILTLSQSGTGRGLVVNASPNNFGIVANAASAFPGISCTQTGAGAAISANKTTSLTGSCFAAAPPTTAGNSISGFFCNSGNGSNNGAVAFNGISGNNGASCAIFTKDVPVSGNFYALELKGNVAVKLRIDQTPVAGATAPTHSFVINLNGTDYRIPCLV